MRAYLLLLFFYLLFLNCKSQEYEGNSSKNNIKQGCLFVSHYFDNFDTAIEEIANSSFTLYETYYPISKNLLNMSFYAYEKSDSHLILSLLIIKTNDKNYIFRDVKKSTWKRLKKAKKIDNYWQENINKKYKNVLSE